MIFVWLVLLVVVLSVAIFALSKWAGYLNRIRRTMRDNNAGRRNLGGPGGGY